MPDAVTTCPGCGHDAHSPGRCVVLTDDMRPCSCVGFASDAGGTWPRLIREEFSEKEHFLLAVDLEPDEPWVIVAYQARDRRNEANLELVSGSLRLAGEAVLQQQIFLEVADARRLIDTLADAVASLEGARAGDEPSAGAQPSDPGPGPAEADTIGGGSALPDLDNRIAAVGQPEDVDATHGPSGPPLTHSFEQRVAESRARRMQRRP